jgi:acyl carrier protein
MPRENPLAVDEYLDETEVQTRISFVLHNFRIFDLHKLDWDANFEKLGMDSLEQTAVLTSIEHEFHTVFEDRVFENFETLNQVKRFIATDHNCF